MNISKLIQKSRTSAFYRKLLNLGLNRMVPFNKPHGIKVIELGDGHLKTMIPHKKANFNHIKGIHACALATLSEFTTGFMLLARLDPKEYRLIMESLQMDYHFQAKMDAFGTFYISDEWLEQLVFQPLRSTGKVSVDCEVNIYDKEGNHISTGLVKWQIKSWDNVKTKP